MLCSRILIHIANKSCPRSPLSLGHRKLEKPTCSWKICTQPCTRSTDASKDPTHWALLAGVIIGLRPDNLKQLYKSSLVAILPPSPRSVTQVDLRACPPRSPRLLLVRLGHPTIHGNQSCGDLIGYIRHRDLKGGGACRTSSPLGSALSTTCSRRCGWGCCCPCCLDFGSQLLYTGDEIGIRGLIIRCSLVKLLITCPSFWPYEQVPPPPPFNLGQKKCETRKKTKNR